MSAGQLWVISPVYFPNLFNKYTTAFIIITPPPPKSIPSASLIDTNFTSKGHGADRSVLVCSLCSPASTLGAQQQGRFLLASPQPTSEPAGTVEARGGPMAAQHRGPAGYRPLQP